jgi:hypothetical protein
VLFAFARVRYHDSILKLDNGYHVSVNRYRQKKKQDFAGRTMMDAGGPGGGGMRANSPTTLQSLAIHADGFILFTSSI